LLVQEGEGADPFEALGNPRRRAILELLATSPRSLWQVANELPISRQAVARHLRFLAAAGLVTDELMEARRVYRLNEAGLAPVRAYLDQVADLLRAGRKLGISLVTADGEQ
jgi:predicted ArsR family transcriptional regulator